MSTITSPARRNASSGGAAGRDREAGHQRGKGTPPDLPPFADGKPEAAARLERRESLAPGMELTSGPLDRASGNEPRLCEARNLAMKLDTRASSGSAEPTDGETHR